MSIKSELSVLKVNIQNAKDKLYTNLVDKGVTGITTSTTLDEMADSVISIGGGNLKLQLENSVKIREYTDWISYVDTSNVTDMNNMFSSCSYKKLTLSSFDTSKVTNMNNMFSSCGSLSSLDISSFNTSNVTNMDSMFYICSGLTSLDLNHFDTSNVTYMGSMFYNCTSLESLNLGSFNTSKVTNMGSMFSGCKNLTDLIWNNFGNGSGYTAISLSSSKLGVNSDIYPNAKQHLIDTLVTNSFDRVSAGYATCKITLSADTKAVLTDDEIAQMTAKGYTIA